MEAARWGTCCGVSRGSFRSRRQAKMPAAKRAFSLLHIHPCRHHRDIRHHASDGTLQQRATGIEHLYSDCHLTFLSVSSISHICGPKHILSYDHPPTSGHQVPLPPVSTICYHNPHRSSDSRERQILYVNLIIEEKNKSVPHTPDPKPMSTPLAV